VQHLNLYSQLDRASEPPFSARQQAILLAVVAVLMLLVYGWLWLDSGSLASELATEQQQYSHLSERHNQLAAKKQRLLKDNSLAREIKTLKQNITFRRELLASVDPESKAISSGFAEHLEGLARQHIAGMWFTEIELSRGGQELALLGQTRAPEFVPRYLQRLAAEPVFTGHQFRIFRLYTPQDEPKALHFELRAKEQLGQSAAGSPRPISLGINQ
jgi:hypothetical protein